MNEGFLKIQIIDSGKRLNKVKGLEFQRKELEDYLSHFLRQRATFQSKKDNKNKYIWRNWIRIMDIKENY